MTTENKRNEMIKRGRIILDLWDSLAHYGLIFALGIMNIFIIVVAWDQKPQNPTGATMTNNHILVLTAINVILMTAFYFIQRKRLELKKETIDLEIEQILEAIK